MKDVKYEITKIWPPLRLFSFEFCKRITTAILKRTCERLHLVYLQEEKHCHLKISCLISCNMFHTNDTSLDWCTVVTIFEFFEFLVTRLDKRAIRMFYQFLLFVLITFNWVFMKIFIALFSIAILFVTLFIAVV